MICIGSILILPGLFLGVSSLGEAEEKGRSNSVGVVGCWMNLLLLSLWVLLLALVVIADVRRGHGWITPGPEQRIGRDFW